jgi:exopolysaccharide biosynthesis polyprenyl glycosylphosphotransferase
MNLVQHARPYSYTAAAGLNAEARPRRGSDTVQWILLAEACVDGLSAFFSAMAAALIVSPESYRILSRVGLECFIYSFLFVATLYSLKGYSLYSSLLQIRETERTMKAACLSMLFGLVVFIATREPVSLRSMFMALLLTSALVTAEKQLLSAFLRQLHKRAFGSLRVLIYGNTVTGRRVYDLLSRSPRLGLTPTAMIDKSLPSPVRLFASAYRHDESIQVLPGPITPELLQRHAADLVLIDPEVCSGTDVDQARQSAEQVHASVAFLPSQEVEHMPDAHYLDCDGVLLALPIDRPHSVLYEMTKRSIDLVLATIALILFAPLIAIAGIAIKVESEGPVFFRQVRIGRDGKEFKIWKLRTMYTKACGDALSPKKHGDPRITRVGAFLRKTSLDELPQLLNVLLGEMSLVGPRPEMKMIVDGYTRPQRRRLAATPGITGLWQISADRCFQIHERIEYDLYYIEHRNTFLDLAVLLHTVFFAVRGI